MIDEADTPRVSARLVLLSLAALWACYFIVATLRGAFMGFDFAWPIISRRLTICILSMLVMAAVWPLLQLLDRKSGPVRLAVVLVGALPLSLLLSIINDAIFSDIDVTQAYGDENDVAAIKAGNVRISRDEAGNILVDLPKVPPAPPAPPRVGDTAAPEETGEPELATKGSAITIHTGSVLGQSYARWAAIADNAFGRYFLVLAWAALYFALAKAEDARAAERREGEYRRAAEAAELRSLRYQVNPHFLFNTLNSLSALVMTGRQEDAEEMIQTLSTFYRRTLSGDPTNDLRLADEIELQKLYFAIEAVRFPNRLLTRIDVDPEAVNAMVPGMILQPLVENSVKYAVAATQRPVTVAIKARREGGQLVIAVSDDGPGKDRGPKAEGCGIGLNNVRDRLRARFGQAGTLTSGKRPDGGFETVLRMPLERGLV
ncbi:sensor histidine kinase [Novosphingobium album (ex Hu et al. 2023)]|uniref:Histidine kinase n=1 Tax=Novosphingobium album (ex Hu et al. 2023) TaxID=2930093 RepID=A0ABT0B4C3_9SPHN|nr:histidine kinase [Novosphingobium album (ex Hu et al. 2023)]MCJ2179890.1 histidine kinase [Novosphingobium album (ex Hu et al. 2023)]